MKEKQKLKNARGITLVALVVTIIVLIILAGVSINMVLGQNGIITQAKEAKEKTLNAEAHEQELMNEVVDYIKNNGANSEDDSNSKFISKSESYVGYYADIDGNGTVDGIIYADLAISKSGEWGTEGNGTYSYEAISGTKDYYVSQTNYEGSFGIKDVLTVTGSGKDRFYVMALENINPGTAYCWYDAASDNSISDYENLTSTGFGTGKTNTKTMIEKWNSSEYGTQNDNGTDLDIWGVIQDKVNDGWFVPSKEEWSAFGNNLGITSNNYGNYGLSSSYWSSSICTAYRTWYAFFSTGYMDFYIFNNIYCVRLSVTF